MPGGEQGECREGQEDQAFQPEQMLIVEAVAGRGQAGALASRSPGDVDGA